jgi:hypothetical protein
MAKAPAPSLLRTCRLFEPARYSQHCLASVYLQLVPGLRPRIVAPAGAPPSEARAARRTAAS